MTDIIKNYPEKESGNVVKYLNSHNEFEQENIEFFREELMDLEAENPTIIAFGGTVFDILKRNLPEFKVLKISHYAHFISKEKLREEVEDLK